MKKSRRKAVDARPALEAIVGPLTFGGYLAAIREGEQVTLEAFAKKLGVSRANLCDIEKGRRSVSIDRASKWAKLLGYSESRFVKLAVQDALDAAGVKLKVDVKAA